MESRYSFCFVLFFPLIHWSFSLFALVRPGWDAIERDAVRPRVLIPGAWHTSLQPPFKPTVPYSTIHIHIMVGPYNQRPTRPLTQFAREKKSPATKISFYQSYITAQLIRIYDLSVSWQYP